VFKEKGVKKIEQTKHCSVSSTEEGRTTKFKTTKNFEVQMTRWIYMRCRKCLQIQI